MSDFNCKCTVCGTEQSYVDLKAAFLDGWNIGKYASCWECSKKPTQRKDVLDSIILPEDSD